MRQIDFIAGYLEKRANEVPSHSVSRIQSLLIPVVNRSKYEMILNYSFSSSCINQSYKVLHLFVLPKNTLKVILLLSPVPPN